MLCEMADLLGVSIDYLMLRTDDPRTVNAVEADRDPESEDDQRTSAPVWQTGTPAEAGDYTILCGGPDKLRYGSYTKAIKRWDGEHWTNGQGVPLRLNVYGWVRLPEVDV
jgi:hypothetical protein